jgi:hypothetical protein
MLCRGFMGFGVKLLSLIESLENSPYQKRGPFELSLSALFWGTPKVSSGSTTIDLNLIFGVENFVLENDFFGDR